MIILSIFFATLSIQVANLWAIKNFNVNSPFLSSLQIALLMIPASFISTVFFSFYYGKGAQIYNYPSLIILAFSMSLSSSFLINTLILKTKGFSTSEVIGIIVIISGASLIIFKEYFDKYLFK